MGTPVEWIAASPSPPDLTEDTGPNARFVALAERHSGFMFKVAHGLLRHKQDAEDAVQETLLKLYRTDGWMHMEDERAFLARTVWRVSLDIAARRRSAEQDNAAAELACSSAGPEQLAAEGDQRAMIRELIDCLPEDLRQPLVLCAIDEMSSREVAGLLGLTEGAVRTRVMRARAELRRRFGALRRRKPAASSREGAP